MIQHHGGETMSDSILTSVKVMMGVNEDDNSFDDEIIPLINAELATLNMLGVGPEEGFMIYGSEEKWPEMYSTPKLNFIPQYIALRIRPMFDTTLTGSVISSMKEKAAEFEWRLNIVAEELRDA